MLLKARLFFHGLQLLFYFRITLWNKLCLPSEISLTKYVPLARFDASIASLLLIDEVSSILPDASRSGVAPPAPIIGALMLRVVVAGTG